MGQPTWEFAADLSNLRLVGMVDLPALAGTYTDLARRVRDTSNLDGAAFQLAGEPGHMNRVFGEWASLRDQLQDILTTTEANLENAGTAIVNIVAAYAATDAQAKVILDRAWRDGPPADL